MIQIDTVSDKMSRCDISCKDIRLTDSSYQRHASWQHFWTSLYVPCRWYVRCISYIVKHKADLAE